MNTKKQVPIALLFASVLAVLCLCGANADVEYTCGAYTYALQRDNTARIEDYEGYDIVLSVPETLDGYKVTSIGNYAFARLDYVESITIPEGVKSIGEDAFSGSHALTSVTLPESVESIGKWAFHDCISLKNITLPSGLEHTGYGAFYGCSSLTSITLPETLKDIETYAFEYTSLTSIKLPKEVKTIEWSAFYGCNSLMSITLPEGLGRIETCAFAYCTALTSLVIPESVQFIGEDAFEGCQALTLTVTENSPAHIWAKNFNIHNIPYVLKSGASINQSNSYVQSTASPTATIAPVVNATAVPTAAPATHAPATNTPAVTATPTLAPTATPTLAPTATPTLVPTATPAPTATDIWCTYNWADYRITLEDWNLVPAILDQPLKRCTGFTFTLHLGNIQSGSPYGEWTLYGQASDNSWVWLESFNASRDTTIVDISLDAPMDIYSLCAVRKLHTECVHTYAYEISNPRYGNDTHTTAAIENIRGVYSLAPQCAPDMRLDAENGSKESGTNIQIYVNNGTNAQKFRFEKLDNGYYEIICEISGMALDVVGGVASRGVNVDLYSRNGSDAQQWKIVDAGNGFCYIVSKLDSNMVLDVWNAGTESGTNVHIWERNDTNAQKWMLIK